jgi:hypothetical protein
MKEVRNVSIAVWEGAKSRKKAAFAIWPTDGNGQAIRTYAMGADGSDGAPKRPVHGQEPPPDNVADQIYVKVARFEIGRNPGLWIGGAIIRVRMRSSSGPDKKRHGDTPYRPQSLLKAGERCPDTSQPVASSTTGTVCDGRPSDERFEIRT